MISMDDYIAPVELKAKVENDWLTQNKLSS